MAKGGVQVQSSSVEQIYWKYQIWNFVSTSLLVLGMFMVPAAALVGQRAPGASLTLLQISLGVAAACLFFVALVFARLASRSRLQLGRLDRTDWERLRDEHERSIRYRSGFRALCWIVWLQLLFVLWVTLGGLLRLPALLPGASEVATLLVAHVVFWIPYLRELDSRGE